MNTVQISAAQPPEFRQDVGTSLAYLSDTITEASAHGSRLLCLPECFLQGYLLDESKAQQSAIDLASAEFRSILDQLPITNMAIVFGMIEKHDGRLFNSAVIVQNGALQGRYRKTHLLKSETFFTPGTEVPVFSVDGLKFGVSICFDTNFSENAERISEQDGVLIVCPANNMMPRERAEQYRNAHNAVRSDRCKEHGLWLASSDVFGERDGHVSWGPTAVIDPGGQVVAQLPLGQAGLLHFDLPTTSC